MVKNMSLRFDDSIFNKLYKKKTEASQKEKTSFSWEEYFMYLAKI